MRNTLILILLLISTPFYPQNPPIIKLNNATLYLLHNVSKYLPDTSGAYNNRIIKVIQFSQLPDKTVHDLLNNHGIKLLDYIPDNAFFASIPLTVTSDVLISLGIRSIIEPSREFKLSPNLYHSLIPDHADMGNGYIEVVILPYRNIPAETVMRSISLSYFEVLRISEQGNYIEAICHINDIGLLVKHPWINHIYEAEVPGEKENNTAITSHRVNTVTGMGISSYGFIGNGVKVSLGDDGIIGPHIDYKGRLNQTQASSSTGNHGDHVAGTIFGAGNRDPLGRGMAPGAEILYYTYPGNLNNVSNDYANESIRLTSSSYSNGCNAGYTNFARTMDETSRLNKGLLHVFSAGNSGADDCGYGAGNNWGNITGGHKAGKNVITVGNVNRFDVIRSSSSRGPAHDGRIKPDVVAVGTSVYSTIDPHDYGVKTGTSMSCPGVAGSLAVLYEAYQGLRLEEPIGGLMKALLLNSADDLGNPGPDFIHGFGRINIRKALRSINNNWIKKDSIFHGDINTHTLYVPNGLSQLKIMLYWTDYEAFSGASKALVNNLDLTIQQGANTFLPLVLNPTPNASSLNAPATPATDTLNNVEQVIINNPVSGNYTVNVNATSIPFGPQAYYIVYYFENEPLTITYPRGGETFEPNTTEIIRWDGSTATNFKLEYSTDSGLVWQLISDSISPNTRFYNWDVPNIVNDEVMLRINSNTETDSSETFVIIPSPDSLKINYICLNRALIDWESVDSAAAYVIFKAGNYYMDSIGYTTALEFLINNVDAYYENWYSVSAVTPNGFTGRRAKAVQAYGLQNCLYDYDIELVDIETPKTQILPSCLTDSLTLTVKIKNNGQLPITDFTLNHSINNGTIITENVLVNILPNDTIIYTASHSIGIMSNTQNHIKIWASLLNDIHNQNDTLSIQIFPYGDTIYAPPFVMDFENSTLCPTTSNCDLTICQPGFGFFNADNGIFDDIDWRVNKGETPSVNTGPDTDNTLGTADGKYIYLEATSCYNKKAELYSPCIDLINATNPILEFYHHRYGNSLGALKVDVFFNGEWAPLTTPITDSTGIDWERYEISLLPFAGHQIAIRFTGETSSSWQGDIALDDISIIDFSSIPEIHFIGGDTVSCVGDTLVVYQNSSEVASYFWNFGVNAQPQSSNGPGPHKVTYSASGNYYINLTVNNPIGQATDSIQVSIIEAPDAAFIYFINDTNVSFVDASTGIIDSWMWNFGDGNGSVLQNPTHTYYSQGPHNATLTVENTCGQNTFSESVEILYYSINETMNKEGWLMFPNSGNGQVTIHIPQQITLKQLIISDINGNILKSKALSLSQIINIDISSWSSGVYYFQFYHEAGQVNLKYVLIK